MKATLTSQNRISGSFIRDGARVILTRDFANCRITRRDHTSVGSVLLCHDHLDQTFPTTSVRGSCLEHEKNCSSDPIRDAFFVHFICGRFPACLPQRKTSCTLQLETSDLLTSCASSWLCGCTAAGLIAFIPASFCKWRLQWVHVPELPW